MVRPTNSAPPKNQNVGKKRLRILTCREYFALLCVYVVFGLVLDPETGPHSPMATNVVVVVVVVVAAAAAAAAIRLSKY